MEMEMEIRAGNNTYFQFQTAIFGMFKTGNTRGVEIRLVSYFLFPVLYTLFKLVCFVQNWKAVIRKKVSYVPLLNKSSVCNTYTMNSKKWNMEIHQDGNKGDVTTVPPLSHLLLLSIREPSKVGSRRRRKKS